ncbi:unnamed protein product [Acanthoscelides obtectus]|uniref:Zinc finger protein on ecdysone puffs n=2 Tax=Acanthoscelides obtectus TaxID=200917 RepID=A0A9P0PAM6_ACAOB|nr:unnamed protein product [Acanthoscelides obtectus]CAK1653740.1 Zinc finger protein on ecdysone puffs [Acanthoscelides obtectus]
MRGRGGPRGSYYRGSSRGSSWGNSRGSYRGHDGGGRGGRYMSGSDRSFDNRSKYGGSSERFSSSRPSHSDEYKSYRSESSYMGRDGGRRPSPDRKRIRMEGSSSRHETSYNSSSSYRHDGPPSSGYHERSSRGYSGERHGPPVSSSLYPRRDDFRSPRGSYRGRLSSSRGARGTRDRPQRRLAEGSYTIRRRLPPRISEFSRRAKISRLRSMIAERRAPKRRLSERMDSDDEKKDDQEGESEEKSPKKEGSEKDAKSESGEDKPKKGSGFIKLHCVHCGFKSLTFHRYETHLRQKMHVMAMRRLAYRQKNILAQMRHAQRSTQNEIEKEDDDLTDTTHYCMLCKLNYKQKKSVHQLSESHKNMKKFLMPTCKVCDIDFKSPMSYEGHLCSIDHMKTKQRSHIAGSDSGEENELENFTTIDAVDGGDGSDAEEAEKEVKKEKTEKKKSVCVGIEQIRVVQAHYCDLCRMYLPRGDDEEEMNKIIARHCKMRNHMQKYVRHKERQALEKKAEKLQRKELEEKQGKSEEDGDKLKEEKKDDSKDAEAETGNKSSDEDEDDSHVNGERYDRFKLSEKLDDDKIMKEDEESILDNKPELKEKLTQ